MTRSREHIRVNGIWLDVVAAYGDIEIKHGRNGPLDLTWGMALGRRERPAPLTAEAALVEVFSGPRLCWSGVLDDLDWSDGTFSAIGIARAGEGAECLNGSGEITSKLNTAIDQAISRGVVPWVRGDDFGNTDLAGPEGSSGVADPDPGKLNELLNQWAVENNKQWRVSADGLLTIAEEDEDTPDWLILPGTATLGVASDDRTDRVFVRYYSSTASAYRTASWPASTPANGVERRASVVHLGAMTAARATTIAQGLWSRMQEGRTGWTNGVEAYSGQIITPGGVSADLGLIRAGQTVRLLDHPDPRGVGTNLDVVLEETAWKPGERTIQLNPVGLAARTWEQVIEEANARGDA